jgi:hypothetical protein
MRGFGKESLWLINAFAVVLLTLLGAAGEALSYDRMLKASTAKRRVHSLFRQGCMLYGLIPTMRDDWLGPLMQRFSQTKCCRSNRSSQTYLGRYEQ